MDFTKFFQAIPENAPIVVLVVLGLVTFFGKLGLKGNGQLIASLSTGTVFGGAFMIAAIGLPTNFGGWFSMVIYGLALGLTASGVYSTGKELITRGLAKQTQVLIGAEPVEEVDEDYAPVG